MCNKIFSGLFLKGKPKLFISETYLKPEAAWSLTLSFLLELEEEELLLLLAEDLLEWLLLDWLDLEELECVVGEDLLAVLAITACWKIKK